MAKKIKTNTQLKKGMKTDMDNESELCRRLMESIPSRNELLTKLEGRKVRKEDY